MLLYFTESLNDTSVYLHIRIMELYIIFLILVGVIGGSLGGMGGPTGFLVLSVLIVFTELTHGEIAGTASTMFFIATIFGATLYTLSGDQDWRITLTLVPTAIIGTKLGVHVNGILPEELFRVFIGILAITLGSIIIYREKYNITPMMNLSQKTLKGKSVLGAIGLGVGFIGGVSGLGGPAIAIPLLLIVGIKPLIAITSAISAGVAVTGSTSMSYVLSGSVDYTYVALIGIPFAVSQVAGWKYAHTIETGRLKLVLGAFQLVFGAYLLFF